MSPYVDKDLLKQYFRSGSRPTQQQFHQLIDNCYNETRSSFVSGYQVQADLAPGQAPKIVKRAGGNTIIVPFFDRINTPAAQIRGYHYHIPVCNVGSGYLLDKIVLEVAVPKSTNYEIEDKGNVVNITQKVTVDSIKVYNGTTELFSDNKSTMANGIQEIKINQPVNQWHGIGIDISISYDIKSDIAISDQLDIGEKNEEVLAHVFGSAGCYFGQISS